jgi:hypothetical protein
MIDKPAPGQEKKPKLLIMDNGPLSVLSEIDGALDWLFKPGCEVWMTDIVLIEARRPPSPGGRPRKAARANFEKWFSHNRYRVKVIETATGERFTRNLKLWEMAGRPEGMEPDTTDLGEASIISKLRAIRTVVSEDGTAIVLMDDRASRAAVKALPLNVDLMGTQTFVAWMAEDFRVKEAENAWGTLEAILGSELDQGEDDDPVYVRNFGMS